MEKGIGVDVIRTYVMERGIRVSVLETCYGDRHWSQCVEVLGKVVLELMLQGHV